MKKSIYFVWIFWMALASCNREEDYPFRDVPRVQFVAGSGKGTEDMLYSFIWLDEAAGRDTVYLPMRISGGPSDRVRRLKLSQVSEYEVKYVTDNKGYVIDSTVTELPNKAVAGVHYVPFDSPEMQDLLVVHPGVVSDSLPVILLRDRSLKTDKIRLRVRFEVSEDFRLGEKTFLAKTIIFSDKLEKPANWNHRTTYALGDYSVSKHELMIAVVGKPVDDEWLEKGNNDKSFFIHWRGRFIDALNKFNADPANIESGLAPLRENPKDPNSKLVTFPTKI